MTVVCTGWSMPSGLHIAALSCGASAPVVPQRPNPHALPRPDGSAKALLHPKSANKKTHRPVASGGGSCQLLELYVAQLTRRPPPEDTLIRVDVPVLIDVIRLALAFWVVEVIGYRFAPAGN